MSTTTRGRIKRLGLAMAVAASLMAVAAGSASADASVPRGASHFTTSAAGWTWSTQYGGLCLVPGVTCALGSGEFVPSGGVSGAPDGYIRSNFATIAGVLSDATVTWSSPAFTVDPKWTRVVAKYKVRGELRALLNLGGRAQFTYRLVDLTDASRSFDAVPTRDLVDRPTFRKASAVVAPGMIHNADRYRIDVITHVTTPLATVPSVANVDYDGVHLHLTN